MCLVKNKDTLKVGSIVADADFFLVLCKTLYIYYRNFSLTTYTLLSLIGTELLHQFSPWIGCWYHQSTSFKLLRGLFQQIKAVNYEIEFGDLVLFGIEIIENIGQIIRQGCFTTTLCVPYHTRFYSLSQFLTNSQRCKQLLITHDMFLVDRFNLSIYLSLHSNICYTIFNNIQQTFWRTHRSQYPISRCIEIKIGLVFRTCMNDLAIIVRQNLFFCCLVNIFIWIITMERCYLLSRQIFFTKTVKGRIWAYASTVESPLYGHNASKCIIFHIVAEYH